jgi:CheY-like chemotaxis protein
MGGQEALERMRGMECARSGRLTPIIAVTAETDLARGFDKVLAKPFDLDALEAVVAAALGRKSSS